MLSEPMPFVLLQDIKQNSLRTNARHTQPTIQRDNPNEFQTD